jgi:hypothetical protein
MEGDIDGAADTTVNVLADDAVWTFTTKRR